MSDESRQERRTHIEVTDPDRATALFQGAFPGIELRADAGGPAFRLVHDRVDDGRLAVNRLRLSGSASGIGSINEVVAAARVRSGRFRLEYAGTAIDTTKPYLRPPGRSAFRMQDTVLELVELDPDAFMAATTEHLRGTGQTARLPAPEAAAPISTPLASSWQRVTDLTAAIAFDGEGFGSPLVRAELFDLLVSSFLATFPLVVDEGPSVGGGPRGAGLRRALSFIEDHLAEPLDTITIARAAHVPVRTLQSAFRTELRVGVMAHVRARRLQGARRDLLEADLAEPLTVREIAARWGFAHPARFAEQFRRAFGENPSETLRR